jgi:hypothetical protein
MVVPIEFLRGVLGILCVLFAHMAGRSMVAVRAGRQKNSRLIAWVIRATVCAAALMFRHSLDLVAGGVIALAVLAAAAGYWAESRPKKQEDLAQKMFPDE